MVSITEKGADVMTKFGKAITDISWFLNEDDDKEKDDSKEKDRKLAGKIVHRVCYHREGMKSKRQDSV